MSALSDALGLSGDIAGRRDLGNDLADWARSRLAYRKRDGRWIWVEDNDLPTHRRDTSDSYNDLTNGKSNDSARRLFAVPGRSFVTDEHIEAVVHTEAPDDGPIVEPDIRALLEYYAAGLRSDTRGSVYQLPERHGTAWQLIELLGSWWPEHGQTATVEILLESLPAAFRQALDRRGDDGSIAVGWPLSVGRKEGLVVVQPVGLLAGEFERTDVRLIMSFLRSDTLVNPDWLNQEARSVGWNKVALGKRLAGPQNAPYVVSEFGWALREAAATLVNGDLQPGRVQESLDLTVSGIQNCLGLFLPEDISMSKAAASDIETLRTWSDAAIYSSGVAPLLTPSKAVRQDRIGPVIETETLNAEQLEAVEAGLSAPLTVVTGPPGTGKSQCVTALVASTVASGGRVLVAAKNHQALDAIEERIGKDRIIRMRDRTGEVDRSLMSVTKEFVADERSLRNPGNNLEEIQTLVALSERRNETLRRIQEKRALECEIAAILERIEMIASSRKSGSKTANKPQPGWLAQLFLQLFLLFSSKRGNTPKEASDHAWLKQKLKEIRKSSGRVPTAEDPVLLGQMIVNIAKPLLGRVFDDLMAVGPERVAEIVDALGDAELSGDSTIPDDITETVLDARPVWLTTTLSLPRRMPLKSELFDLVVIDEASQADIASSLPALARSKRAVIVGDNRQLSFISSLSLAKDRNLLAAVGLFGQRGLGKYSQGRRTLFDLALAQTMRRSDFRSIMLREQYRSAPEITEFIGESFYEGKLRPAVDFNRLIIPKGSKPGLAWTDVKGSAERATDRGYRNRGEAAAIAAHLKNLLVDLEYPGTVGVVAPFNAQVRLIRELIDGVIPSEIRENAELKVDTVDSFQGEERCLIVFSVVSSRAGPAEAERFLRSDRRRLNVAISRGQAVTHIFGDLEFAKRKGAPVELRRLAVWSTEPRRRLEDNEAGSIWEIRLRDAMRQRGWDPKPQYPIVGRRLDFALLGDRVNLDIEVDGRRWHQDADGNRKLDDHFRDAQLRSAGWKVVRFWVDELARDMEGCLDRIEREL